MLTLADDSGLEVDALDGAPGVLTAFRRFDPTQPERNALLLQSLTGIPDDRRSARFRCVVALAGPDGLLLVQAAGTPEGVIASAPAGRVALAMIPFSCCRTLVTHWQNYRPNKNVPSAIVVKHFSASRRQIRQALNLQP